LVDEFSRTDVELLSRGEMSVSGRDVSEFETSGRGSDRGMGSSD